MKANPTVLIALLLFFFGCVAPATPPELTLEPKVSLGGYHALVILPVSVREGESIDPKLADELGSDLVTALKNKGYVVNDDKSAPPGSMLVRCTYESYKSGSVFATAATAAPIVGPLLFSRAGDHVATVSVTLLDRDTSKPLGDMVVDGEFPHGVVISSSGVTTSEQFLQKEIANVVAKAIDEKIKGR